MLTETGWVPTAAELAALFRAHDAYVAGYYDEYDDHDAHDETRHLCRLRPRMVPERASTVIRALRGIGIL